MTIKKSSHKKSPTRSFNSRSIHKGKSYTAKELATLCNVDESVIHRWRREEGLIPIDGQTPSMFYWQTAKQFIDHKNNSKKMPTGQDGDFPCFKCKLKRRAFDNKITVTKRNDKLWNGKAICSVCGTRMNMGVPANDFALTITWGYEVVKELPKFSIIRTTTHSSTTTDKKDHANSKFTPLESIKFCAENERIKYRYFDRVIHRQGKNKSSLRKIVSSILVFEEFNKFANFKQFQYETAKEFQKFLTNKYSHSLQSAYRIMQAVQEFFLWLKEQRGYKRLEYDDIKSLRLSLKDTERAKYSKPRKVADLQKWEEMIMNITPSGEVEVRGRAIFALFLLSGMRIEALISLRIGDLNLEQNYIDQNSTHVNTKFSQSHKTNLWKFREEIRQIVVDWVKLLREEHSFTNEDPLFPKIHMTPTNQFKFERDGFKKEFIKQANVIREELANQFENANLDYYTPHTIRHSLIKMFMEFELNPEQLKAVSQNISHKSLETTINSYYQVHEFRKDQIINDLDIEKYKKMQKIKDSPKFKYIISQLLEEEVIDKVFEALTKD